MFRALLWKELRAGWVLAAVSALAHLIAAFLCIDRNTRYTGQRLFDYVDLVASVATLSFGLGIALSLWQTVPEMVLGTAAFLAHTSRSRNLGVAAKIAAGLGLYVGGVILPLLAGLGYVTSRITVIDAADTALLWLLALMGFVTYLGLLAVLLRGVPWKEGFRQIGGASVIGAGLFLALVSPSYGIAWTVLLSTAAFAGAWAFSGFASREF